jgi:hypothetical protein
MEFHPAANLFPLLGEKELHDLAEDIREHGLHHPVILYDAKILDGRNRFRACELAGVQPRFEEWNGDGSPIAWVLSENLHRRHLTVSQQGTVAAEAIELFRQEAEDRLERGRRNGGLVRQHGDSALQSIDWRGSSKPSPSSSTSSRDVSTS